MVWAGGDFGHAGEAVDVQGLVVEGLRGTSGRPGELDPVRTRQRAASEERYQPLIDEHCPRRMKWFMTPNRKVLFGLGLESGVHQVSEMLGHARLADDAGLNVVSLSDHPYFAERIDAYAALGFVPGATTSGLRNVRPRYFVVRSMVGAFVYRVSFRGHRPRTGPGWRELSRPPGRSRVSVQRGAGRAASEFRNPPALLPPVSGLLPAGSC